MSYLTGVRRSLGWSRRELESRSGLSYWTLVDVEKGTVMPKPETIVKLADGLGLTFREVRDGIQEDVDAARQPPKSPQADKNVIDIREGKRHARG